MVEQDDDDDGEQKEDDAGFGEGPSSTSIQPAPPSRSGERINSDEEEPATTTKGRIFQYIKRHPGSHLREIRRGLNLAMGVIQYHLNSLEKEKKIVHQRSGIRKRFYPSYVFGDRQQEILAVLSQEIERDLILCMIDNPKANQKQFAEMAGVSPATINWHMKRLVDSGLVSAVREGQFMKYVFRGDTRELLNLVQNYHASVWTRWADRLSEVVSQFGEEEGPDEQQREGQQRRHPTRDGDAKDGERFEW